jgi:hypothetical protein|tara:strand:+ start:1645 stop:1806 length:162 start_codon:yes stop_codon:yes gene_type:complete
MADKFDKRRMMAEKLEAEKPKKVELKPRKSKSTTNSKLVEGGKDVKRTKKDNK